MNAGGGAAIAVGLRRPGGGLAALPLSASGGTLPLTWLINGAPLASLPYRRQAQWQPDGPGLARITTLDGAGPRRDETYPPVKFGGSTP